MVDAYLNVAKNVGITIEGNWMPISQGLQQLSRRDTSLVRDASRGARRFLERFKWLLFKGIVTRGAAVRQDWEQVSVDYANVKFRRFPGSSAEDLLQGSQNYVNAILDLEITQKNYLVSMKFKRGVLSRKSWARGIPMRDYIMINEYGGIHSAPRPLWEPAFRMLGGHKGCAESIMSGIKKRLETLGLS